jgi:hypothetical protein
MQVKWGMAYQKWAWLHQTFAGFARINWCPYFLLLKVGNFVPIEVEILEK